MNIGVSRLRDPTKTPWFFPDTPWCAVASDATASMRRGLEQHRDGAGPGRRWRSDQHQHVAGSIA
jgi:hypothetical protein